MNQSFVLCKYVFLLRVYVYVVGAGTAWVGTGKLAVLGVASKRARTPALAAVSPKRERGPCKRACEKAQHADGLIVQNRYQFH